MRIAVVNQKGGVGKTTTAIYLAAGLHSMGRTMLLDADRQQSAIYWTQQDPIWPFPVLARADEQIHQHLPPIAAGFEHVVIDTPPGDMGIIRSACLAAELVIVPVSPTGLDVNRLMPTVQMLAEVEMVHPIEFSVLLTRMRKGTLAARGIREVLAGIDMPVLDTEIPLSEQYAGSFGIYPTDLGAYADLIGELK